MSDIKKALRGVDGLQTVTNAAERIAKEVPLLELFDKMPSRVGAPPLAELATLISTELLGYVDAKAAEVLAILEPATPKPQPGEMPPINITDGLSSEEHVRRIRERR